MTEQKEGKSSRKYINFGITGLLIAMAIYFGIQLFTTDSSTSSPTIPDSKHEKFRATSEKFQNYLQPPLGLYTAGTRSKNAAFNVGMDLYNEKKYVEARETWNNLPPRSIHPDTLNYYMAGTYFAEGNYQKANYLFQKAKGFPGTKWVNDAQWYLSVCNAKLRNTYLAVEYLKPVEHPLRDQLMAELEAIIPE